MATRFSAALQMTNSTDPLWRAWVQFVDDVFVASGGWVNTADTGQMTISTSLHPTIANTIVGYRIYRMADALQATAPLFVKCSYGSSAAAANSPQVTIALGTGTDGAGNITGSLATLAVTSGLNGTNASTSYGSADTNRCQFMLFVRNAATDSFLFSVERTKDATTGADTADGFLISWQDTTPGTVSIYLNALPGAQPPAERWCVVLSNANPSTFGSNTGIGFPLHFKGFVQPVGLGIIVVNKSDFLAAAQPSVSVYGTNHTYQLADSDANAMSVGIGGGGAGTISARRFGIRFE